MIVIMIDFLPSFFSFTGYSVKNFSSAAVGFSYLAEKDVGRDLIRPFQTIRRAFF